MPESLNPFPNETATRCPRCPAQLPRGDMIKHLWLEHRLLLDGKKVRDPWRLIEDWIERYCQEDDPELLDRCRALAQRVDPEHGLLRVQGLFLANKIEDAKAQQELLAEVERRQATLCPQCYTVVPIPAFLPVPPLDISHGRLSSKGYRVEVWDHSWVTRLEIETPEGFVYLGQEPDRLWTRQGAKVFLVGPLVVLALVLALVLAGGNISPLLPVVMVLQTALILSLWVHLNWKPLRLAEDRVVDHAWNLLVPRLHHQGYSPADAAFLSGLAMTSIGRGLPSIRAATLHHLLRFQSKAVLLGQGPLSHLVPLRRLAVADAVAGGEDPLPLLVEQVDRCFRGRLPLAFAEQLLTGWDVPWWTPVNRARFRILLCDQAFEAGFEVRDLLELGQTATTLGTMLGTEESIPLAQLRLLWSLRPRRPWDRLGAVATAFDLALHPDRGGELLGKYPDLLLLSQDFPDLCLRGRALMFQDIHFLEPPQTMEVWDRGKALGGNYQLSVDDHHFLFPVDPSPLVGYLERWSRYAFHDFYPRVAEVYSWRSPRVPATLCGQETVTCPECRQVLIPHVGNVAQVIGRGIPQPRSD